jgi:hypothetical protein
VCVVGEADFFAWRKPRSYITCVVAIRYRRKPRFCLLYFADAPYCCKLPAEAALLSMLGARNDSGSRTGPPARTASVLGEKPNFVYRGTARRARHCNWLPPPPAPPPACTCCSCSCSCSLHARTCSSSQQQQQEEEEEQEEGGYMRVEEGMREWREGVCVSGGRREGVYVS